MGIDELTLYENISFCVIGLWHYFNLIWSGKYYTKIVMDFVEE